MAGLKSFLETVGADAKKVFSWVGTPKGQTAITTTEAALESVADAIDPALAGFNTLITNWTQEVFKAEALASAAGAQSGTGVQKAADVSESVVPQAVAFAEQNGLNVPTATDIETINNALVTIANVFTVKAPASNPSPEV